MVRHCPWAGRPSGTDVGIVRAFLARQLAQWVFKSPKAGLIRVRASYSAPSLVWMDAGAKTDYGEVCRQDSPESVYVILDHRSLSRL